MSGQTGNNLIRIQLRMALACVAITVLGGALGALHYVPRLAPLMNGAALTMPKLRPLHTTFASLWIFGAAIAVIYHFLSRSGEGLNGGDVKRFWFQTACWLTAGAGVLATLLAGIFSGREYLGFHPAFSVLLLVGWLPLAYSVLKRSLPGFWRQPVYLWFWTVGVIYFIITFTEGHLYLLPWVGENPIRDLQVQWKSCGTLVGSFNFLVYGSLIYVSEKISGDDSYGQSPIAFWLFGVGCLNSFTNFAHHTYHLPQTSTVKWIAFVVSMMEILILMRLLYDIRKMLGQRAEGSTFEATRAYLASAKWWTASMIGLAIFISIPSLNSLIHGTKVVTGHAMGTELGIDTMILLGCIAFLLRDLHPRPEVAGERLDHPVMRWHLVFFNASMAIFVGWLVLSGTVHGIRRYNGVPPPDWVAWERFLFPITGAAVGLALLYLVVRWIPLLWGQAITRADTNLSSPAASLEEGPTA